MREALQNSLPILPLVLVQLGGFILALCLAPRHTKPAVLILLALVLAVGVSAIWIALVPLLTDRILDRALDPEQELERFYLLARWGTNLLMAFSWALMIAAAFVGRSASAPRTFVSGDAAEPGRSGPDSLGSALSGPSLARVAPLSKGFYLGSILSAFILQTVLVLPGFLLTQSRDESDLLLGAGFICVGMIPMLYGVVILMTLIYKIWAAIQGTTARTTPGKAVGFLFIPFFGFYWIFQVYWGWACDYNELVARHGIEQRAPHVSQGLALTVCILALVSAIPIVGIPVGLFNLGFLTAFFNSAINGVNALAEAAEKAPDQAALIR